MLRFHLLRVAEIRPDAEDAVVVSLEGSAEVKSEYHGLAGQHVVLRAQIEGVERRRTYSPFSPPGQWPLQIAVRVHRNGRMSRYLATELRVGDEIDVLPPNGSLTPRFCDRRTYVGFASGCGITPVLSIARALLATDARNRFILFYGNTSTARAMCLEELQALKDRHLERLALHFVMSREPQEADLYNGRLDAQRVKRIAQSVFDPQAVAEYFVCGPGHMIEELGQALRECGVEPDRIHDEHFNVDTRDAAAPPVPSEAAAAKPAEADQSEVTVIMDGRRRSFTMRMNAENVLDAAARAGLELPFSCRAGVCSTCRTKVVRGEVEMAQNYALEEWELREGYVLACQSRVKTAVLELDYDEK
jgi:ring-1,2-phenylacetyl-CoA epoxidase subunit PaaE